MAVSRRGLLRGATLLAGGLVLGGSAAPAGADPGAPITPDPPRRRPLAERLQVCRPAGDPLDELLRRNRAFSAVWREAQASGDPRERARLMQERWPIGCQVRPEALAEGQKPWAALLACADSRVAPEWIFASGSGELFEVRCAGNTAFDAGVASLEYAVANLDVPLILVLGHSGCGAVQAAMATAPLTPLLEELVVPIRASLRPGLDLAGAVAANARAAAERLGQRSALLHQARSSGRLRIQAAVFDIASGRVGLV